MIRLRRRRADPAPAPAVPVLSFCESVYATATSPWHIRVVGPEGHKPNGGIPGIALCGRDLCSGWDLTVAVTDTMLQALTNDRTGTQVCSLCRADAIRILTEQP